MSPGAPTPDVVDAWRRMLDQHATLTCELERALKPHGLGLGEFETLDRVVDADCDQYRMNDLADDIHLSQSALSRAVARLERDGLVHRTLCTDDRRGVMVCLTDDGRRVHAAASAAHREVLQRSFSG